MAISARRQQFLTAAKIHIPSNFLINVDTGLPADDNRILAYGDLVMDAWNNVPPETWYTIDNCPQTWINLMAWGCNVFAVLFMQQTWTLMDFGYSDMGLNINLDRVQKLDSSYKNLVEMYRDQVKMAKKNVLMHQRSMGVGSSRWNTNIGGFLKLSLGASFSWNSP